MCDSIAMSSTDTYLKDEMTISEVADAFNVTVGTVREWDRRGKLRSFRTLGNQRRFRRSENPAIPTPARLAEPESVGTPAPASTPPVDVGAPSASTAA